MKIFNLTLILLAIVVIMAGKSFASTESNTANAYQYVIDLTPSVPLHELYIASKPVLKDYKLYTIRRETPTTLTYDIRLGFFKTREQAQSVLIEVEKYNINGRVDTVKQDELHIVAQWRQYLTVTTEAITPALGGGPVPVDHLMVIADQAMQDKSYVKAIGLYTRIINTENSDSGQVEQIKLAQEKLALARERNDQLAHAKAEYQAYLDRYPGGEGAVRVSRRLNRLIMQQVPGADISNTSQAYAPEAEWRHNGNLYQFYHRNKIDVDDEGSFTANSVISTNINYLGRTLNNPSPMEVSFSATNLHDTESSADDETRVTSMYFDMTSENRLFDIRLGRQKSTYTSIFNRFDGIEAGYMVSPDYKAKLIFGYPYESTETVDDRKDKYFYSAGITIFPDKLGWNSSLYYLEQKADSVLDRQEIAVDTRYQGHQSSFYSVMDYSLQYETLNLFLATYNKQLEDQSWINIVANYRKNPFLTTTNALLGQTGASSIADLLDIYTEEEIEQLSLDRTAAYKSLSAYYTHYINSDVQISADITASNMSGTDASEGVEALQDTDNEYSYSLGLVRKNLFTQDDMNIINMRRSNLATSDALLLSASTNFRIDDSWLIRPGFSYDTRNYNDGRSSEAIRPMLRINNIINRYWQLEMEVSYDDKEIETPGSAAINETNKQFYAGYMYTF